jgi:SOS-response transcriptional repressor LexA
MLLVHDPSSPLFNGNPMENKEIRRANMLAMAEELGGLQALSDRTKVDAKYLSQVKNRWQGRGMGDEVARRIEIALEKPRGWMDALRYQAKQRGDAPMFSRQGGANYDIGPEIKGKVPLISWVQAGSWSSAVDNLHPGDAEEWVETTVPIHQHTYALRVRGDSMTNPAGDPSFPDGAIIVVEPNAIGEAETMLGQYVIVKRTAEDEATFKQLVKDAGRYFLKPLNPRYPMLELNQEDAFCGVVRERVVRFF